MNEFLLIALALVYLAICRPSLPRPSRIWQRYWHKQSPEFMTGTNRD
jgi:hypothetical protein